MPSGNIRSQTVWRDVYAGNIFIDKNFNAWVMDLRGGWVEEFGHSKKAATNEGSVWQDAQRIFDEWISRDLDCE